MISGYLLGDLRKKDSFIRWYFHKLLHLYVPLWVLLSLEIIVGYMKIDSLTYFIQRFIFPAMWFTASMVVLYVFYWLFVKILYIKYENRAIAGGLIVLTIVFVILFYTNAPVGMFSFEDLTIKQEFAIETPYLITHTIWMACMLLGLMLRYKLDVTDITVSVKRLGIITLGSVCGFLVVRVTEKKLLIADIQILLPLIYIIFAISLFLLAIQMENKLSSILHSKYGKVIGIISMCSIEIYYIQFIWIKYLKNIVFPINWLLIVWGIVISSYVLHHISRFIINRILSLGEN